jgi:hypothetical protein
MKDPADMSLEELRLERLFRMVGGDFSRHRFAFRLTASVGTAGR